MIDNLELDFSSIPYTAATTFQVEELESLHLDNESLLWNNNLNFETLEPISAVNEWLDNIFNDGFLDVSNKTEEAKEDFNRVLEEWQIHLGGEGDDQKTGGGVGNQSLDLRLDDVVSLENICCLNDDGAGVRPIDFLLPNLVREDVAETKGQDVQVDAKLVGSDFALEAFDLSSLLEKFEASGGCDPIIQTQESMKLSNSFSHKETKKKKAKSGGDRLKPRSKVSSSSRFKVKPKVKESSSDGCRHVLPVAQLPRFSIILKRDPVSVLGDVPTVKESLQTETVLQEHDYCSSSPCERKKCEQRKSFAALSTQDVFAGREMRSVLRPQSEIKNTIAKEVLYSKLPEYYTELVRPKSPTPPQEESVADKSQTKDDGENGCCNDDDCFDKLPSYITGIATVIDCSNGDMPTISISEDVAASATTNVPKDVNVCSSSKVLGKRKATQQHDKVPYEREYFYLCSEDRGSNSRNESENVGPRVQRSRTKRYVSSRSPSNSDSSSRSRSRSRSPRSFASSRSRSCSSSRSGSEKCDRNQKRNHHYKHGTKSKEEWIKEKERQVEDEKKKQIEDRRVVHVGNIKLGTTHAELRRRFSIFGPIEKLNMHHRDHGDCYAFITYLYKVDAFEALEHGNDDPMLPKYELSLGGRRLFCLENYSDLDSVGNCSQTRNPQRNCGSTKAFDFDALLNAAKSKMKSGNK